MMLKHAIGDEGLKIIKTFTYAVGENQNDSRVVMDKIEKHCIGDVNKIYERYYFNKRDKIPMEAVDSFDSELKTLEKTCNFCDCLCDSLIHDHIVLSIKNEQTTMELLRIRDLTLNRCIDICRSEEIAAMQMKSLLESADSINQVKSKILEITHTTVLDGKKCLALGKTCKRCNRKNRFTKKCKKESVYCIGDPEDQPHGDPEDQPHVLVVDPGQCLWQLTGLW